MHRKWTPSEKQYLQHNAAYSTDAQISIALTAISGRPVSQSAVRNQRRVMKISKLPGRGICKLAHRLGDHHEGLSLRIEGNGGQNASTD
jgi:hypothetical protein